MLFFSIIFCNYYLNSINSLPNFDPILNRNNPNQIEDKNDNKFDIYFKNNDNQKSNEENGFKFEESISLEIKCEFR